MVSIWMVPAVPDIDRYDLACDGIGSFWIELKRELSTGERNRIRSAGVRSWSKPPEGRGGDGKDDYELNVDMDGATLEKTRIWISNWSLTDDKNRTLPRDYTTLRGLRTDVYDVIEKTVDEHAKRGADRAKKDEPTTTAMTTKEPVKTL